MSGTTTRHTPASKQTYMYTHNHTHTDQSKITEFTMVVFVSCLILLLYNCLLLLFCFLLLFFLGGDKNRLNSTLDDRASVHVVRNWVTGHTGPQHFLLSKPLAIFFSFFFSFFFGGGGGSFCSLLLSFKHARKLHH